MIGLDNNNGHANTNIKNSFRMVSNFIFVLFKTMMDIMI